MAKNFRMDQVNEILKREIATYLVKFPTKDYIVTILDVETSNDLSHATVWVSAVACKNQNQDLINTQAIEFLCSCEKEVKEHLLKTLDFKKIPDLDFKIDNRGEYGTKMDKILDSLK